MPQEIPSVTRSRSWSWHSSVLLQAGGVRRPSPHQCRDAPRSPVKTSWRQMLNGSVLLLVRTVFEGNRTDSSRAARLQLCPSRRSTGDKKTIKTTVLTRVLPQRDGRNPHKWSILLRKRHLCCGFVLCNALQLLCKSFHINHLSNTKVDIST